MALKSRRKGALGEREAVLYLKELGFCDARRRQQSSGFQAAEVECIDTLPNVHFEVKYGYAKGFGVGLALWREACAQAMADAGPKEWAVMWKEKGVSVWKLTIASPNGIGAATFAGDEDIGSDTKASGL